MSSTAFKNRCISSACMRSRTLPCNELISFQLVVAFPNAVVTFPSAVPTIVCMQTQRRANLHYSASTPPPQPKTSSSWSPPPGIWTGNTSGVLRTSLSMVTQSVRRSTAPLCKSEEASGGKHRHLGQFVVRIRGVPTGIGPPLSRHCTSRLFFTPKRAFA